MRPIVRYTLGIAIMVQVTGALPSLGAQGSSFNACKVFDAAELKKLTGRKDFLGRGPIANDPSELPKNMSACSYLEIHFGVTSNVTPELFARNRKQQEARPDRWKVESVSGVGDEAYFMWDKRPGDDRQVGIVVRANGKSLTIEDTVPSDSIETMKKFMVSLAKQATPRMK